MSEGKHDECDKCSNASDNNLSVSTASTAESDIGEEFDRIDAPRFKVLEGGNMLRKLNRAGA